MIIRLLFLLLLFAAPAQAFEVIVASGGSSGGTLGDTNVEVNSRATGTNAAYCYLNAASGSGNLNTPYINITASQANTAVKICIYSDNGDSTPGTADLLVGCSNSIPTTSNGWLSGTMAGTYAVTGSSNYWICDFVATTGSIAPSVSGGATAGLYYKTGTGFYDVPPANMGTGWNTISWAPFSIYVTIQ